METHKIVYVYCDASIVPCNPGGHGVAGFVIKDNDNIVISKGVHDFGQYHELTNNAMEYAAVAAALQYLIKLDMTDQELIVRTDSQLVVRQLNGDYGCSVKMAKIRSLVLRYVPYFPKVTFEWIPREQNREADAISRSLYFRS